MLSVQTAARNILHKKQKNETNEQRMKKYFSNAIFAFSKLECNVFFAKEDKCLTFLKSSIHLLRSNGPYFA